MRIALVHDWNIGIGGDMRVLNELQQMFPKAKTFVLSKSKRPRYTIPFLPLKAEALDLSDYDVVISTGSIFSKGIIVRPSTYHINYCHSPTRQVWDLHSSYKRKLFQHFLRIWDRQASTRVDKFIANSENTKSRIKKYYRRDSEVIYPPVEILKLKTSSLKLHVSRSFLIVSRLYKHKNIDIAIKAFNKLKWPLTIIGTGPEYAHLKALAGPTVHLLGYLDDSLVATHYSLCNAFIMPQEEDFGIAGVEALMHGKPVLALRRGGALEYVQEGINGLFFDDPHEAVLADGVRRLGEIKFDSDKIKQTAQKFSCQKFQSSFYNIINQIAH